MAHWTAIELHIRNAGTTAASQLRLTLERDYHFNAIEGQHYNLRRYAAFTKEIQMLAPGSGLRFLQGVGHRILSNPNLCPLQFTIQAEYGFNEKTVKEKTIVDLEPFGKSNQPIDPLIERMDKLIAELETIRRQMPNVNE